MSKKKKLIIGTILIMVFLIVSLVGSGYYYLNMLLNKAEYVEIEEESLGIEDGVEDYLLKYEDGITNILLFGIDSDDGVSGRSDSIMLATVDSINGEIKLSSIMRDSYVEIQGKGMDKINHAYAYGGAALAINTVNSNFKLNVKDFVAVDFSSMADIVDILGGIEMNITSEEVLHIPGIDTAGVHHLNGEEALAYTRIRYTEGDDYRRTERQRDVLQALLNKALQMDIKEYPSLLAEFLPLVKTNLKANDILDLATEVIKVGNLEIQQDRFPRDGYTNSIQENGVYYLGFDKEETIKQMHEFIFE